MQTFQIQQCDLSARVLYESCLLEGMSDNRHTGSSYAEHLRQILLRKFKRVARCKGPVREEANGNASPRQRGLQCKLRIVVLVKTAPVRAEEVATSECRSALRRLQLVCVASN